MISSLCPIGSPLCDIDFHPIDKFQSQKSVVKLLNPAGNGFKINYLMIWRIGQFGGLPAGIKIAVFESMTKVFGRGLRFAIIAGIAFRMIEGGGRLNLLVDYELLETLKRRIL